MNNNQLQLVTFEQAKRLKAAGFDWETSGLWYRKDGGITDVMRNKYKETDIAAPTVALALKWFRDVKDIPYSVRFQPNCKYGWEYYLGKLWKFSMEDYDDQEAAESALLDELLTII